MKLKQITTAFAALVIFAGACKKANLASEEPTGEALNSFKLSAPANFTALALNAATPAQTVDISWTAAKPGLSTAPTYKWVAALKTGNIDAPILEIPSNNSGKDAKLTLTLKQIDDALASKGVAAAAAADLIWSVVAENGSVKVRATDVYNIKITRFGDGVTPFAIYGPASSSQNVELDPASASNNLVFKWQKSNPAVAANAVKYRLQLVKENDPFGPYILDVASDNNGADTVRTFSHQAFSDSLTAKGFTDLGVIAQLKWRVVASSGNFNMPSLYTNILYIAREVKMYMVGGFQGWNPANGIRMIPDTRSGVLNNMFWCYIYLPAGTEFKFLQGQAWGLPDYGDGGGGNLSSGGGNIQVATAGVYRVSMNKSTLKFNLMAGRMGFVGAASAAGWNPGNTYSLSSTQMQFDGTNKFFGVHTFTAGGWKMIDNNQWDNGSKAVDETRSYGSNSGNNGRIEVNGPNMPDITTPGTYRVMWDASDIKNPKYEIYSDLRIVGAFQGWDFGTAPSMNYLGNGIWQRVITLTAGEFKFVAKEGWDFNYGGTGGVLSRGGGNLNVPAGTYTITVDEYNKTYTIL